MNAAEVLLLVVVIALPLLLGAGATMVRRPWWWAAVVAVVVALAAMVAPEPEAGEARLAAGDLPFVAIVCAVVVALVWLGGRLASRVARSG